jgi:phage head maturation protease
VDATGLKYSYDSPKRSYANDLLDAIDQGDVSQSSFAFKIKEQNGPKVIH